MSLEINQKRFSHWLGAASGVALMAAATPASAQIATEPSTAATGGIEEIVVTAQKREQSLQSVPVAVTALTAEALDRQRITHVGNLSEIVPNFTVIRQPSNVALPAFSLRGVLANKSQTQLDNGVGVYVDGVYLGRSAGSLFDVADLQRIEVLRGPQGTLFGRNTTGGAVNLITRTPPGEFGIRQDVSYGNFNEFRTRTRLDLPAFGDFSASITYLHREIDGYVKNLSAGTTRLYGPATDDRIGRGVAADTLGKENVDSIFAAVHYDGGALTLDYKFDWTDFRGSQLANQVLGFQPNSPAAGIFAAQPFLGGTNTVSTSPLAEIHEPQRATDTLRAQGHSFTAAYEISDNLTVKNIAAYRKLLTVSRGNSFDGNLLKLPDATGAVTDFTVLNAVSRRPQKQFSNELQLVLETDRFDLVTGAFYFTERAKDYNPVFFFYNFPEQDQPITIRPQDRFSDVAVRNNSFAVFAQAGLKVTDEFTLTGGARYTWDRRRETNLRFGTGPAIVNKASSDKLTWTAIAEYQATPEILLYGKVATGYLSGGLYNGVTFLPEELTSYEVGFKGDLFDRTLRLNLAAFLSNYTNLQTGQFVNGLLFFENAGKARIKGLEAEATLALGHGLRLNANLGLIDFDYLEYISRSATGDPVDITDIVRLANTPKMTFTPSVAWESERFGSGQRVTFSIDAPYRSDVKFVIFPIADPALEEAATSQAHWTVNSRISIEDVEFGGAKARISLFGQNLFNKRVVQQASDVAGVIAGSFNRPRTYGVEASFEF